jgi:hypothetical protein
MQLRRSGFVIDNVLLQRQKKEPGSKPDSCVQVLPLDAERRRKIFFIAPPLRRSIAFSGSPTTVAVGPSFRTRQ